LQTSNRGLLTVDYIIHGSLPLLARSERFCLRLTPEEERCKARAIRRHTTQLLFHRYSYPRFAAEIESFTASSAADAPFHPVRGIALHGDSLDLEIVSGARIAVGSATLYVVGGGSNGGVIRYAIGLPTRGGVVEVRDLESSAVVASAELSGGRRNQRLSLPRALLGAATTLFVKVEHSRGFFDEDGWKMVGLDDRA
jgi:hypothetical protein